MSANSNTAIQTFRIAIASDIHAHEQEGDDSPSHLRVGVEEGNPTKHPIEGLKSLIKDNGISADYLLCPGDLGDKASRKGIQYAWRLLNDVKTELNATAIVATVGNHDVDSYGKETEFDPQGYLQSLAPKFPLNEEALYDRFWSRHFAVIECDCARIISLNSSAFHGYKDEHQHGRISEFTISQLKSTLQDLDPKPVNILMCHHHPLQHSELALGEHDVMRGGQLLLDLLGSGSHGEWLLVHGHKHHPKICYAAGSASSPIVFAAGSLCANLFKNVQASARNQFYVLEFNLGDIESRGLVGTFSAWDWIIDTGWQRATSGSGLPGSGAFGERPKPLQLANQIDSEMGAGILRWSEALMKCPELKYLIPSDLSLLFDKLKKDYNIKLLRNDDQSPAQLERTS